MADLAGSSSEPASPSSSSDLVGMLTTLFSSPFSSLWTRKRYPYNFRQRFRQTQSLPPDNSARIFLDSGGFKAWLAHFLITTGEAHYSGREARQRLLRELETLPSEERARIAQEVSASTVHPSAQAHVREMEHQALAQTAVAGVAGRKRRRQ